MVENWIGVYKRVGMEEIDEVVIEMAIPSEAVT